MGVTFEMLKRLILVNVYFLLCGIIFVVFMI